MRSGEATVDGARCRALVRLWLCWQWRPRRSWLCVAAATWIFVYAIALAVSIIALATAGWALVTDSGLAQTVALPIGLPWLGAHFRLDPLGSGVSRCRQPRRRNRKPVRARLRAPRNGTGSGAAVLPRLSRRHESGRARRRRIHVPVDLGVHVADVVGAGHGAPSSARQHARRLHLPLDGEPRHAFTPPGLRSPGRSGRRLRVRGDPSIHSFRS